MGDSACPGLAGPGQGSPLLYRMLAGAQLRRLRVDQGLSYEAAAAAIGAPPGLISMMENGETTFRMRDMVDLADLYGVTGIGQRATLLGLAQYGNRGEWWQNYLDVTPGWFERYLGLEQAATLIRSYEPQLIPGLLQAPGYIRAVLAHNPQASTRRAIGRRAELRIRRQNVLHRPQPARLWAIIGDAALRPVPATRAVMAAQLRHLLNASDMPNVTIQMLPFSTGAHLACGSGPISLLRLPDDQLGDVIYLEQLTSAAYLGSRDETHPYQHALDQLSIHATASHQTQDVLAQILHHM